MSNSKAQDKQRLDAIRMRHARAPDIQIAHFGNQILLEAKPDRNAPPETVAEFVKYEQHTIELFEHAKADIIFLLGLIERASKTILSLRNNRQADPSESAGLSSPETEDHKDNEPKNYAAECGMLCKEPAFKKFLKERHGLGRATDEATADKVREKLAIASRTQLNTDEQKQKLWRSLVRDFQQWKG